MSFAFQQNNKMALLRTKGQPKKTPKAMELGLVALKASTTSKRGNLAPDKCRKDCAGVGAYDKRQKEQQEQKQEDQLIGASNKR